MKKAKEKKNKVEELNEQNILRANIVTCGDISIESTTESLDKVMECVERLIKNYSELNKLKLMDKISLGIGGIG